MEASASFKEKDDPSVLKWASHTTAPLFVADAAVKPCLRWRASAFSFFLSGKTTPRPGRLVFVAARANTKVHRYKQQDKRKEDARMKRN